MLRRPPQGLPPGVPPGAPPWRGANGASPEQEGEAALEEARQAMRLAKMAKDQAVRMHAASDAAEAEDATLRQRLVVLEIPYKILTWKSL